MTNPIVDAIVRLEHWLDGGADFKLKTDVRLVIDTLREAESLAFDLEQFEARYRELRADVDRLLSRGGPPL